MSSLHLGELLVRNGVLTPKQRDDVLAAQQVRGGPFGALAECMFGVSPSAIEDAWAEQYAQIAAHVDPRVLEIPSHVLEAISRRQAWQFRILPLEIRGNSLIACTTKDSLVRALKFAGWRLGHCCQFVLAEPLELGEALERNYPLPGMSARMLCQPASA